MDKYFGDDFEVVPAIGRIVRRIGHIDFATILMSSAMSLFLLKAWLCPHEIMINAEKHPRARAVNNGNQRSRSRRYEKYRTRHNLRNCGREN